MSNEKDTLGTTLSRVLNDDVSREKPDFAAVYAESARRDSARRVSNHHRLLVAVPVAAAFAFALPFSFLALSSRSFAMRAAVSELSSFSLRDSSWEDGIYRLALEAGAETEMSEFIGDIWNP